MWWKQDPNVMGFITLMNSPLMTITASLQAFPSGAGNAIARTVTLLSHNTQMIESSTTHLRQ